MTNMLRHLSRKKRILAGIATTGLLIVALGFSTGVLAADDKCTGKFPVCFLANTPAKASDMNHNLNQIVEWIENKVGTVGDNNVNVPGTATVTGVTTLSSTLNANGDILTNQDSGQIEVTNQFAFRDTTDSWLRLNQGQGSTAYADLAVGKLYQHTANGTALAPRLIFKADYYAASPTRSTTRIPDDDLTAYCGDDDGCKITLIMRNFAASAPADASFGPLHFQYKSDGKFRSAHQYSDSALVVSYGPGTDGDGINEHVLRAWDCFFTDGAYTIGSAAASDSVGMYLLNYHYDYLANCVLIIDD